MVEDLVELRDVTATMLSWAGVEDLPVWYDAVPLPGEGMPGECGRDRIFGMLTDGWMNYDGRFKLHRYRSGEALLFDIENDPQEQVNLLDDPAYADIRHRLEGELFAEVMTSIEAASQDRLAQYGDMSQDPGFRSGELDPRVSAPSGDVVRSFRLAARALPSTLHVIHRGRGNPEKNKARRLPPFTKCKGARAQRAGDARNTVAATTPSIRHGSPLPLGGRGLGMRANRAAMGRTRQQPTHPSMQHPLHRHSRAPAPSFPRTREPRELQSTSLEHQHRRNARRRAQRDHGNPHQRLSHDVHPKLLPTRDRLLRTPLLQRRHNPSPRRPQRLLPRLRRTRPRPHPKPRLRGGGPDKSLID